MTLVACDPEQLDFVCHEEKKRSYFQERAGDTIGRKTGDSSSNVLPVDCTFVQAFICILSPILQQILLTD